MTANEFRKLALDIPQVTELEHVGHPDFRFGGKVFASLGSPDADWGMVKLKPEGQRMFVEKSPGVFKPCTGAWGKRGYTNVHLASATKTLLLAAFVSATKNIASNAKKEKA
ncbi:MAG: MmcQ/YjbR family DNA-binding protein [Limisphaerales bacterium]